MKNIEFKKQKAIEMLDKSECITDEEKQYWKDILDLMKEKQIDKLINLLWFEKRLKNLFKKFVINFWDDQKDQ